MTSHLGLHETDSILILRQSFGIKNLLLSFLVGKKEIVWLPTSLGNRQAQIGKKSEPQLGQNLVEEFLPRDRLTAFRETHIPPPPQFRDEVVDRSCDLIGWPEGDRLEARANEVLREDPAGPPCWRFFGEERKVFRGKL